MLEKNAAPGKITFTPFMDSLENSEYLNTLQVHELTSIFNALDSQEKIQALDKILRQLDFLDDESNFANIITPAFLSTIAKEDERLTKLIFTDVQCLTIFLKDIGSFPTYLLSLCETQSPSIYKLIFERNKISERRKLFESLLKLPEPQKRNIMSQLLSFYDQAREAHGESNKHFCGHMVEYFANEHSLISGDDAFQNLKIICKSKMRRRELSENVTRYRKMALNDLFTIAETHQEIADILFSSVYFSLLNIQNWGVNPPTKEELESVFDRLLPIVMNEIQNGNELAKLAHAEFVFAGYGNIPSEKEEAIATCIAFIDTTVESRAVGRAFDVLVKFAHALESGTYHKSKIASDPHWAYIIHQFIATKSPELNMAVYTSRDKLREPTFLYWYGQHLESVFVFDKIYDIYSNISKPTKPEHSGHYDLDNIRCTSYVTDMLAFALIKTHEARLLNVALDSPTKVPRISLEIAEKCAIKKEFTMASGMLLPLKDVISQDVEKKFSKLCFEIALEQIALGNFSIACSLLKSISVTSSSFTKAQNFLKFSDPKLSTKLDSQEIVMSADERLKLKIEFFEAAYAILSEALSVKDLYRFKAVDSSELYHRVVTELKEVTVLLKHLHQALRHSQNNTPNSNSLVLETLPHISSELKHEIERSVVLKDAQKVRQVSVEENHPINFWLAEPVVRQPKWSQDNKGEWIKNLKR